MRIFVKTLTCKTLPCDVSYSTTVIELKQLINNSEGIPIDQMRLIYGGHQLQDSKTMEDYAIEPQAKIHMVLNLRGGGSLASFASMNNFKKAETTRGGPDRLTVLPGMHLQGDCSNKTCKAYDQLVVCNLGYGKFDVKQLDHQSVCPLCGTQIKHHGVGFYDAATIIDGITGDNKPVHYEKQFADVYYEQNDGKTMWRELKIAVTPYLKNSLPLK